MDHVTASSPPAAAGADRPRRFHPHDRLMASAPSAARASDALRALRERFRETSAGTIATFEELARQLAADPAAPETMLALRRELHRVHGTAGSYGFAEASRLAATLEARVIRWERDAALERPQRAMIIGHFASALKLAFSADTLPGHAAASRRRMLLVDVPAAYARGLRSEAALRGYQLTAIRAGDVAPNALRELAPHVVIVPAEGVAELLGAAAAANIPVIALAEAPPASATPDDPGTSGIVRIDASGETAALFDVADRLSLGSSSTGATVLVLDDDPSILTIVQFLLESEGVRIMTCEDPAVLHQRLAATAPSLLVMDVRMGEVSGIELAHELRTLPAYRDLPIVLISADTDERTREQVRRAGVDDFIAKPIVASELSERIARHLERQRVVRLAEGRHPGTGLPLAPRTATDVAAFVGDAASANRTIAMAIVRPDVDELTGEAAMGWLRETQRISNAVASAASVVGYHDGVSLMAVLDGDAEVAESLFQALVVGCDDATAWRCGIVDSTEVAADVNALRRAAEDAIDAARQDRASPVKRWRQEEAGLAPDVVLVEDDAALSDMVQYVLRSARLSFRAYGNGEAALEALSTFRTNGRRPLLLLDVDLPGLDGHALHDRLRAARPDAYAVVFITGHASDGDQIRALRAGALDYVRKPVSFRTLAGKIPLWLERASPRAPGA